MEAKLSLVRERERDFRERDFRKPTRNHDCHSDFLEIFSICVFVLLVCVREIAL